MAIGFTPKFSKILDTRAENQASALWLLLEAIKRLGWEVAYVSKTGIAAFAKTGTFKSQHEVKATLTADGLLLYSESLGSEIFDLNRNKKLVYALEQKFLELLNDSPDLVVLEERYSSLTDKEKDLLDPNNPENEEKGFWSLFVPVKGYVVTPILLYLNISVYLMMVLGGVHFFQPSSEHLLIWGANLRPLILEGELWRLFTACFVHIGIFHLFMNMYALVYVGVLLERIMGSGKFVVAYVSAGLLASMASIWYHDLTISAGASGAIFGLYGVFLALLSTNLIDKATRKAFLTSILIFVGYNLVYGMKAGIDNAAHIGGLLSGVFIGYMFYLGIKRKSVVQSTIAICVSFILVIGVGVYSIGVLREQAANQEFVSYMDDKTIELFEQKMNQFTQVEAMALKVYNMPESTSDSKLKKEIKERGIYYWKEAIKVIEEIEAMRITAALHQQNLLLLDYCYLRISSYQLMYKAVDEGFDQYEDSLNVYNVKIEGILKELNGG